MSDAAATAEVPAYQKTNEWKELVKRQQKLSADGKVALLELTPIHKNVAGGLSILGKIRDKYKNLVADTSNIEDRIGIGPMGAAFRFDDETHLKWIYMLLYCPICSVRLVPFGQAYQKRQHQFFYLDEEASSATYAENMEEDVKYKNKIFSNFSEETLNFLCIIAGVDNTKSLNNKKADLCRLWDAGRKDGSNSDTETRRLKLKAMIDSPDIDYYEAAYAALAAGVYNLKKGFYKSPNGVYYYNEEILGNSIELVVSYFKTHDDIYIAYKKSETPEGKAPAPIT